MRYKSIGNAAITVDLPNDYIITAIADWDKERQLYIVNFYINYKTVYILDFMEDFENTEVVSDAKMVRMNLTRLIEDKYSENAFQKYMDRYDHMLLAMDLGLEMLEDPKTKELYD